MTGGTVIGSDASRARGVLAALLVAGACAAALVAGGSSASAGPAGGYFLDEVGTFNRPVHVDDDGVNPELLFIVEVAGTIRVVKGGNKKRKPFLDIVDIVGSGGEEGLLSVAFHPGYADNRRFYVVYTTNGGDIRVDQFKRRDDKPTRARFGSREKVIKIQHDQGSNHNGGQLQFGDDGDLYISVGDGGPQEDPEDDAQRTDSLLGKILRISPRAGGGYDVPTDNPYVGGKGLDEIFALGLRNPYRFSFDSETGALTIGDVGGNAFEEVNYEADGGLGANFGWNDFEGLEETTFGFEPPANPHAEPIHAYPHTGVAAITGGYVVRDPGLPDLQGQYLFADHFEGELRAIEVPSGDPGAALDIPISRPSSFGEGAGRQIYVVSLDGGVFALEPNP
jgi:glucose/arabinose dehydrogenase